MKKIICTGYAASAELCKVITVLSENIRTNPTNNLGKVGTPSFQNNITTDVRNTLGRTMRANLLTRSLSIGYHTLFSSAV